MATFQSLLTYQDSLDLCQYASIGQLASYYKSPDHVCLEAILAIGKQRFEQFSLYRNSIVDINIGAVCQLLLACVRDLSVDWYDATPEFQRHVIDLITNGPHIETLHFRQMPAIGSYGPRFLQHVVAFNIHRQCNTSALADMMRTLSPKRLCNVMLDVVNGNGKLLSVLPDTLRSICLISQPGIEMKHVYKLCARSPHLLDLLVYRAQRDHDVPANMADLVASCSGTCLKSLRLAIGPLSNLAELAKLKLLTQLQLSVEGDLPEEFERFAEAVDVDFPLVRLDMECERVTARMANGLLRFRQLQSLHIEAWDKLSGLRMIFDCLSDHPTVTELLMTGGLIQHECPSALRRCRHLETLQCSADISLNLLGLVRLPALRTLCVHLNMWQSVGPDGLRAEADDEESKKLAIRRINVFLRHLAGANQLQKLWLQLPLHEFDMELEPDTLLAMRGFTSLRDLQIQGSLSCPQIGEILQACAGLRIFENSGCSEEASEAAMAGLFDPIRPDVNLFINQTMCDLSLK